LLIEKSPELMSAIAQKIESIVGTAAVREWSTLDATQRQSLAVAIAPGSVPDCVVSPQTPEELAEVIACADRENWRIIPSGSGSKLHWGGLTRGAQIVLSTRHLDRPIEHAVDDFTLTVEAGMTFTQIQAMLAKTHQFLAIDPAYAETATIGGIVATADTGSWRQRYNSVRDQLLGISFCRADGQLVKAGGRVVKNVAGYDLMKLMTGAYGTLGIATQVTFRLYPIPEDSQTIVLTGAAEAIATAAQTLLSSALTPTAIDLLSAQLVAQLDLGTGLGLMVRFQSLSESVREQSERVLEVGDRVGLSGQRYRDETERDLWQRSRSLLDLPAGDDRVLCKIGVKPTAAVAAFAQLETLLPQRAIGLIHASSGLGKLVIRGESPIDRLTRLRSMCQSHGGFLTVLAAPLAVKQRIEVWGYNGNALSVMQAIHRKFDPKGLLSPDRFLGLGS
jgi:glycolate oxidase FAD binding subunit